MSAATQVDIVMVTDLSRKLHDDVFDVFRRAADLVPRAEYLPTIYLHGARKAMSLTIFGLGFFLAPDGETMVSKDHEILIGLVFGNMIALGAHGPSPDPVDAAFDAVEVLVAAGRAPRDDAFMSALRRILSTVQPREFRPTGSQTPVG